MLMAEESRTLTWKGTTGRVVVAARHRALAGGRLLEVRELEGGVGPQGRAARRDISNKGLVHLWCIASARPLAS